jgi:glycosyltransferase involved in cell wall biosynthesis
MDVKLKLIYYLTNICNNKSVEEERNSVFSQAGKNRSEYIMSSLDNEIEVVSLAIPRNKGYFKRKMFKEKDSNVNYYYPSTLSYFKLQHLFIMIDVLIHLNSNLKKNDIILCYNANIMYVLPIMICKLLKKIKVVYEIEELYSNTNVTTGIRNIVMNITENYMLKYSDAYIIVCEKIKDKIRDENKPILINFGYETKVRNIEKKLSDDENIIIYCGRLDYEGGIEIFLKSLYYIKQNVHVIITGAGPLQEKISDIEIHKNNIKVTYLGFVDDDELNDNLLSAKVCVNPLRLSSAYSNYSFPSKIMMYLSYGCNVVSSQSSGIAPLLDKFENIFVYDEDSSELLAEEIEKALLTPANKKENIDKFSMFFKEQEDELKEFWKSI